MQRHTPSSRPHWLQSHPYPHRHITPAHHHIDTPSYRPARYGSFGAGQGAAALTLVPVTPIPTSSPRHIITTSPRHHHPGTSSYYPARYGSNGAGQGAAALDNIKIKKIYMLNHFFVEKFVLTNMFI